MKTGGYVWELNEDSEMTETHDGMTLRDYFAGQALVGLTSYEHLDAADIASFAYTIKEKKNVDNHNDT